MESKNLSKSISELCRDAHHYAEGVVYAEAEALEGQETRRF
jgi:hypothetical protein